MRKHATRLAGALLAAAVAVVGFGFAPTDALAKKADEGYTYTVRIYAGAEGDIGGKTCYEVPGLAENGVVNFDPQGDVNVFDSDRYYVRGIRVSGEDDVIYSTATAIPVDGDADYVVAYGVKSKSQVAYVARYVDASGQQIADDSPTYYGNEGDAPVVAATYVAGYEPRAASLQQELTGGSTNVFTFVYDAIPENVVTTTVTETTVTTTTEAAAAAPAATAAAPAAAAAAPAAA
ncbi:MAG: hypothetical protein IKE22_11860, partial [Atopobiaceae bacterium]|nr:hypothetical protein [Atopobiaceae bacterium]